MDAKLKAEIAAAEAELAAARAELAAIDAGKLPKEPKRPKSARRATRTPVHHPESDLRSKVEGWGGPAPVGDRMRTDMTPVVTKHVNPMNRPVRDRMPRKVSVTIYDKAGVQQGLTTTMMEREADALQADLPFGWTLTARPCK